MKKLFLYSVLALSSVTVTAQELSQFNFTELQNVEMKQARMSAPLKLAAPQSVATKAPRATFTLMSDNHDGTYALGVDKQFMYNPTSVALTTAFKSYFKPYYSGVETAPTFTWTYATDNGEQQMEVDENGIGCLNIIGVTEYPVVTGVHDGTTVRFDRGNSPLATENGAMARTVMNHEYNISMFDPALTGGSFSSGFYISETEVAGMGTGLGCDEIVQVFNKPTVPMIVYGGDMRLVSFPNAGAAPLANNSEITIELWSCNVTVADTYQLELGDLLGTTKANAQSLTYVESVGGYNLDFEFTTRDAIGLEVASPVIVPADSQFAVVLKGFENDDVNAVVCFGMNGNETAGSYMPGATYVKLPDYEPYDYLRFGDQEFPYQNLVLSLSADMPSSAWVFPLMDAPVEGGYLYYDAEYTDGTQERVTYNIVYTTMPLEENGTQNFVFETPDWISVESQQPLDGSAWNTTNGCGYLPVFVAQPLPDGETGRSGYVRITCPRTGMNWGFPVGQGEWDPNGMESGVETAQAQETKAYVYGDQLNLVYGECCTVADVYNVAGVKVASYQLPEGGSYTASVSGLADGVYVVVFNGDNAANVKFVK